MNGNGKYLYRASSTYVTQLKPSFSINDDSYKWNINTPVS